MQSAQEGVRRRALKSSYWEGAFYSLVVATAENFALVFAVSKKLSPAEIGFLTTFPLLLAAIGNLVIPSLVTQKSLKRWIVGLVLFQILGILLLFHTVFNEPVSTFRWLFGALAVYWLGGLGASPLWIDWMSGWLPTGRLGRFFSKRSSVLSLVTLFFTLSCSWAAYEYENVPWFFAAIFGVALLARLASLAVLLRRPDPIARVSEKSSENFCWRGLFVSLKQQDSIRALVMVLVASVIFRFVANLSSPYFLPYMMSDLNFSTGLITFLQSITYMSTFLFMTSFAHCIRQSSLCTAVQVCFAGIVGVSAAWVFSTSPTAIAAIQFFNGLFWSGLELSIVLWIQSAFPQRARALMGMHLALAQFAAVLGSLLGAHLVTTHGFSNLNLIEVSTWLRALTALSLGLCLGVYTAESASLGAHSRFVFNLFLRPILRKGMNR